VPKRKRTKADANAARRRRRQGSQGARSRRSEQRPSSRRDEPEVVDARLPRAEAAHAEVVSCRLMVNPAGFAFAERLDEKGAVFIPPPAKGGAMDGDEVVVAWWPAERGPQGTVRSVTVRKRTRITGILRRSGKHWYVEPDDPRVLGTAEIVGKPQGLAPGLVVVGSIVDYPDPWNEDFTIKVERALGPPGSLETEEEKILVEHGIDPSFSEALLEEAEDVPDRVLKADREGRVDMRDMAFMTIDPPDARDFDDAVCIETLGKDARRAKLRVHVAVADVSHYVRHDASFDAEAVLRCFSTYLPNRAIPMLPNPLSAGICSLVPKKDRCAMVVSFEIDTRGRPSEAEVRAAVIRSHSRLTYDQVAAELASKGLPPVMRRRILQLRQAADRLRAARMRRGAIELSLPEVKIVLDEDDRERIRGIVSARDTPEMARAYNLIEEFMLAANEGVARLAVKHRLPVIYRVHDRPDEERVERFAAVAELLGVEVDPDKIQSPKGMQAFLRKIQGHPRHAALNGLLLRTLAQAEYSTQNIGHYALASRAYLHFTSPIRRYPDLVNHRVLKAWAKRKNGHAGPKPVPAMPTLRDASEQASRSSTRERAVVQAERDVKALFAAMYMRDRIGDRFEGTVSGLSHGGVFVTLDDPPVDGMIRRALIEKDTRESYELDEVGARMVGSKTGATFTVGDRVIVEVTDASPERRQIDFALMGRMSD
jgi:ribonuclease R